MGWIKQIGKRIHQCSKLWIATTFNYRLLHENCLWSIIREVCCFFGHLLLSFTDRKIWYGKIDQIFSRIPVWKKQMTNVTTKRWKLQAFMCSTHCALQMLERLPFIQFLQRSKVEIYNTSKYKSLWFDLNILVFETFPN